MNHEIFEMGQWPCATVGLHWALQDYVKYIATLINIESPTRAVYEINVEDLPHGETALHTFNALRNIEIVQRDFACDLNYVKRASLYLDSTLIDSVDLTLDTQEAVLPLFSDQCILPFFIVDNQTLCVKLDFERPIELQTLPKRCLRAQGLLVTIKTKQRPFFVGASNVALLSWDSEKLSVVSKSPRPSFFDQQDTYVNNSLKHHVNEDWVSLLNKEKTSLNDLWDVLPIESDED